MKRVFLGGTCAESTWRDYLISKLDKSKIQYFNPVVENWTQECMDREIYERIGGFVSRAIFNEDMIYAGTMVQNGYNVAYAADARVYHSHNYSGRQQFHRNFDLGVSQAEHPEIFEGVPSEGEGIRLVKRSLGYLIRTGHFWLIPQLIWQSGMKYAGYFLGKRYRKLPRKVVLACTMSPYYWNRK